MTDADEVEFTELVDAHIDRVDLVDKAANGRRFLIAKQDAGHSLIDPATVRRLIGKAEPATEQVTMTGSPAAIAKLIHDAAVKAKYGADDRRDMADSGQAMDDGSYPVADRADLGRAIKAVGRGGADHDKIRRHIIARAKALGASAEIPDNWNADGSLKGPVEKEKNVDKATETGTETQQPADQQTTTTTTDAAAAAKDTADKGGADKGGADTGAATATEKSTTKADDDTPVSLTKKQLSDLLKDEITKATQPFKDALTRVEGELAKVMQTPQSGGPARTRTDHQTAVAKRAENLRAQISYLQQQVAVTGGDMQQGYRERLEKAEAALLELDGQP